MSKYFLLLLTVLTVEIYPQQAVTVTADMLGTTAFYFSAATDLASSVTNTASLIRNQISTIDHIGRGIATGEFDEFITALRYQSHAFGNFAEAIDDFSSFKLNTEILDGRVKLPFTDKNGKALLAEELRTDRTVNIKDVDAWTKIQGERKKDDVTLASLSLAKSTRNLYRYMQEMDYYTDNAEKRLTQLDLAMQDLQSSKDMIAALGTIGEISALSVQQSQDSMHLALNGYFVAGKEKELQENRRTLEEQERILLEEETTYLLLGKPDFDTTKRIENNNFLELQRKNIEK